MVRLALFVVVLYAACAAGAAQVPPGQPGAATEPPPFSPETPDGAAPPAVAGPEPGADRSGIEADFVNAKARFDAGDGEGARAALEAFVARHPSDPVRPSADLLLARLALIRGEPAAAVPLLGPLTADPAIGANARYYLGLAELRLGRAAQAKDLLVPFLPKPAGGVGGADASNIELYGALAEATAGLGDAVGAIVLWDSYQRAARDHERAFARQRAEQLAAQVPGDASARAFGGTPPDGLARAVLGPKAAAYLRAQGDGAGAALVDGETARARRTLGFDEAAQRSGPGDPSRVGLALPLSGKFQPVGEASLRAALLAVGAVDAAAGGAWAPAAAGVAVSQLVVRDTATDPDRAARGVLELAREEAVIGVVGAAEKKAGPMAIAEATQDGLPLLALDDQPPGAATTGFQLIHSPEARVAELARRALKLGARDFAILGPDSASGKRLREAFRKEITAGGGRVTVESTYVAGAMSFSAAVSALKKGPPPQAVFVPDSADRLELIAPALAFADLWPQPWAPPPTGRAKRTPATGPGGKPLPRPVLLLSTANDLSPKLLQNAGRYVQGALLSPGFFADEDDTRARAFVDAYRAAYGQDPHATEAYAFDGVRLLRRLTESGARTRTDLLRALAGGPFEGLTGDVRFGADHARIDPPVVYVVEGDDIKALR
jgi:ABC-type branched-subunit amino acid transport system substrate-binding protein